MMSAKILRTLATYALGACVTPLALAPVSAAEAALPAAVAAVQTAAAAMGGRR